VTDTDVLVVGGGVIGLCAALELVREGWSVLVVERREIGAGASGNNAGSCAIQNKLLPLVSPAREAVRIWQAFHDELAREGLNVDYTQSGGFRIAETPDQVENLKQVMAAQRALGTPVEFLTGGEARAMAPYLGPSILAATWCPEDGFCDVLHSLRALTRALRRRGGTIWTRTEVTAVEKDGAGLRVETSRRPVRAGRVLICTGIWARDMAEMLRAPMPLHVRINILTATLRVAPVMHHIVTHASHKLTIKQLKIGTVLIGGGWQGQGDYRAYKVWPEPTNLGLNWRMAVRAVPALAQLEILRSWAGIEGRSVDDMPLIGPVPGLRGAYIGVTCPGGWTIGPFIGRALAEMARTTVFPKALERFNPARYLEAHRTA
jgi:glycine/D-amino acid oxidase-like deaminating enzyme